MDIQENEKSTLSLKTKVIIVILSITVSMMIVGIAISYAIYARTMDNHYKKLTISIGKTTAAMMDGDKIEQYIKTGKLDEEYDEMLNTLFEIRDSNECKFLYIQKPIADKGVVYYVMDADEPSNAYSFGETEFINEKFKEIVESGAYKNGIYPEINYTESNGWLCSGYVPITNSKGEFVAQVGTDIAMDEIMADRYRFLVMLEVSMGAITIISIITAYLLARRSVIIPLTQLTVAASDFMNDRGNRKQEISKIAKLEIHANDEMEKLSLAIKQMENDINRYLDNWQKAMTEQERIVAELDVARRIQESMLPCAFPPFPDRKEFDIFASMDAAKEIGGDFYDFFFVDDKHLAIVMADVSGSGVPAALFMVISKTLIKNYAQLIGEPSQVFEKVNEQLYENNDEGLFVTAFMGIVDLETGMLSYVNAGHVSPLISRNGQAYECLMMQPSFILAGYDATKYQTEQIQLSKGDILFTYTDGVTEAMDANGVMFSGERLCATLNETKGKTLVEVLYHVTEQVNEHTNGVDQADDITMLAFQLNK